MTIAEIEDLRAKGWQFDLTGDREGWMCSVVGLGLAHGQGGGETLLKAAETALKQAQAMQDDPKILIEQYGPQIEELVLKVFGDAVVYQGLEAAHWETDEPVKILILVEPKVSSKTYVNLEIEFIKRAMELFPREVWTALIFEVDWPEEKGSS